MLKNKKGIDQNKRVDPNQGAAGALAELASQGAANKRLIETSGGIPLLVGLLRDVLQDRDGREFSREEKMAAAHVATALHFLNEDSQVAAIAACGGRRQLEAYLNSPIDKSGREFFAQQVLQRLPPEIPVPAIPSGEGTRVAMFSARFDGGPVEEKFRKVYSILRDHKYDVLMVAADAGESFADLTTKYLGRLHREQGTMLAVCTKHYGEMTDSAYSSHKELKFALDYEKFVRVLPLKVEDTYPPQPPGGPGHKYDKEFLAQSYILSVFKPGLVRLDCQDKSEIDIAVDIATNLQKYRVATRAGYH